MRNQAVFSIIVPVYNVEKYLDRCMESLVGQTLKEIEILLVDDGSTDSSGSKCDLWAERDMRVRVLHKKNAGLGYARNSGIDKASGKYVIFVDSDDYIELTACEKIAARLEKTGADICCYGLTDLWAHKKRQGIPPEKLFYAGPEIHTYIKDILGQDVGAIRLLFGDVSACSVAVQKSLLDRYQIRFLSEQEYLCEDVFYKLSICMHTTSIAVEPSCIYYYCHNDNNSLTTRYRPDRLEAACRMYYKLKEEMHDYSNDVEIGQRIYRALMQNLIVCMKHEVIYKKGKTRWRNLKRLCENPLVRETMANYPIQKMPVRQRILFSCVKWGNIPGIIFLVKMKLRERGGVR